jgi:hypothetical protein
MRYTPGAPKEANGAQPVNIQDQHSRALDLKFLKPLIAAPFTTLAAQANPGDTTITLTATTGFANGVVVGLSTPNNTFYFGEQVGAAVGSVITLDTPIDVTYPAGASAFPANQHMNVDGSTTTQIFQVGPVGGPAGFDVDITRIMGYIEDATAMDDSKFGGITRLTYGISLRVNNTDIQNLWNVKSNGELGLLAYDTNYTTKSPAGFYGFRFRNTYAGQSKHGVTLRLYPGDKLEILVQDNLTDLTDFQVMAQGHIVVN